MRGSGRRIAMVAILIVVGISVAVSFFTRAGQGPATARLSNTIGVIYINGAIAGGSSADGLFGSSVGADDIIAQLQEAQRDDQVKAVVIRLNTPGGSAAASEEIGHEVQRLREAGKVVVASMGDLAASGGYWIASVTDHIVASPATITGSIGVIMQVANVEGLYEKLGIRVDTIKSGEHKDIGSSTREMTETERELLQDLIDDMYDQFVTVVATGRNLPRERVLELADGRIFSGRQALELGLVDSLGNYQDAIAKAAELAGLADDYQVKDLRRPRPLDLLFGNWVSNFLGNLTWPWQPAAVPSGPALIRWVLYPQAN